MADKRMFTKKITESDAFLDMPLSAQCLYFHLNMNADDDGFVNAPKKIQRLIGAKDDDLKLLIMKSFLLVFEHSVVVIKHWRMHNTIRQDRYHPTDYQDEFKSLGLKDNGSYSLNGGGNHLATKCIPNGNSDIDIDLDIDLDLDKISKEKYIKRKYGLFKNVELTDEEYQKLKDRFSDYEEKIENLSSYIASKGDKYKSHYATILNWSRKDNKELPKWFNENYKKDMQNLDELEKVLEDFK